MFIFELYKPFKDRNQEYQDSYSTIGTHHKDILTIFIQSLDHKQPFLLGVERNLCLGLTYSTCSLSPKIWLDDLRL